MCKMNRFETSVAAKKGIFHLRLIAARPKRIHARRDDTTESTSLDSGTMLRPKESTKAQVTLSPPTLPNVVNEADETETTQPAAEQNENQHDSIVSIIPPVEEAGESETTTVGKLGCQEIGQERVLSLPAINIPSDTLAENNKFPPPEKMHSLDVPSVGGRSRTGSVTTVSSSGLLTTASSGSIFGSDVSRASSSISFMVRERLHSLARDINRRTMVMKQHIQQPPTPDNASLSSSVGDDTTRIDQADKRSLYSFGSEPSPSPAEQSVPRVVQSESSPATHPLSSKVAFISGLCKNLRNQILPYSIDPHSNRYLAWLFIVSACFLYNAYAIPMRYAFPYQTKGNLAYWLIADYSCDIIYLIDMIVFKPRLRFMRDGLPVKERKETKKYYLCGWYFKFDLLSLLPLDFFYALPRTGVNPMLRIPRLLKIRCYWDMFYSLDSRVKNPYALRIGKTLSYMVYMIHCNGCIYYALSSWEGIGSSEWTYNGEGNKYLRCFYFAAKLATSIGNNPDPTNFIEYAYMTICWMLGVFVFALLLGQIRDIVATANRNKEIFRKTMDAALDYCAALNLPKETRDKVRLWFIYTWQEQKTLNEDLLLEKLPRKLQTDLAISVHYQVLSKVQLFQDCDKALLRDLVLKLKPVLYLPGDYVCRKGEVGKEMYIVNKGVVEVVGGSNNDTVFATLREGSVFGEISLLALAGGNRRTADVRSKGFSYLFVLSKTDLNETIRDYPEAQRMLKRKAKKLIKSDAQKKEKKQQTEIEKACEVTSRLSTPRLLPVVAQIVDPSTSAGKLLRMMVQDDSKRRGCPNRPDSEASEASSLVDDVMSGMPIEQVIQLHCESDDKRMQSSIEAGPSNVERKLQRDDDNSNRANETNDHAEDVQVVDETINYTVEHIEDMMVDEATHVHIKAPGIGKYGNGDEDDVTRRAMRRSPSNIENRLNVPNLLPLTHGGRTKH